MKLYEVVNDNGVEQAITTVKTYTNDFKKLDGLEQAIELLMQQHDASYEGSMYRAIVISGKEVDQVPDARMLTSLIHKFDVEDPRDYVSWSKTDKGMFIAIENNGEVGTWYDHIEMPWFIVVMEQSGIALDINKLLGKSVFDPFEEELLAKYSNPHIVAYVPEGGKVYSADEFQEAIAQNRKAVNGEVKRAMLPNSLRY